MKILSLVLLTWLLTCSFDAFAAQGAPNVNNLAELEGRLATTSTEVQAAGRNISVLVRLQNWMSSGAVTGGRRIGQFSPASLGIIPSYISSKWNKGLEVAKVLTDGPADQAGLRAGDVITAIGKASLSADPLFAPQDKLQYFLDSVRPGDHLSITYIRDRQTTTVSLVAAPLSRSDLTKQLDAAFTETQTGGGQISVLTQQILRARAGAIPPPHIYLGIVPTKSATEGLHVSAVTPGSPAGQAGLKSGDVIITFGAVSFRALSGDSAIGRYLAFIKTLKVGDELHVEYVRNRITQATLIKVSNSDLNIEN